VGIHAFPAHLHRSPIFSRGRLGRARHRGGGVQDVAGAHGARPAHVAYAGAAHARRVGEQMLIIQPHEYASGVPAARDDSAEGRVPGRLLVDVEGLRYPAPAELDDFVRGHGTGTEIEDLPRLEVVPITHSTSIRHAFTGPTRTA